MRDPYEVLGVAKTATAKDIKSAYRKLAKKYHPDQNPNDPKAKEQFTAATQAYDVVGDDKQRKAYDSGEIDAEGKPRFQGFDPRGGGADPFAAYRSQGADGSTRFEFQGGDAGDIFSEIFGQAFGGGRSGASGARARAAVGPDLNATLEVDLEEVARAGRVDAIFPDGRKLGVKLPAFLEDGQSIRLKGQGEAGPGGPGDAIIKILFKPHPRYRVEGRDLRVDLPVAIEDAVLGAKLPVETPTGRVAVNVPAWSSSDKVLRLKGKGLPLKGGGHGDLYVQVRIMLRAGDADLEQLAKARRG